MQIGCSTLYGLLRKSVVDSVKELSARGFRAIELAYEYPQFFSPREIHALKKIARDFSLSYSMHCPWIILHSEYPWPVFQKFQARLLKKSFGVAESLEATHCVIHGGRVSETYHVLGWSKQRLLECLANELKPLVKHASDHGIKVVAENCLLKDAFGRTKDLAFILKKIPELGFCLDIAHAEVAKQAREFSRFRVDYVHATDNHLRADEHLAIGKGKINYVRWLGLLARKGFKGKIIIECISLKDCVSSRKKLLELIK